MKIPSAQPTALNNDASNISGATKNDKEPRERKNNMYATLGYMSKLCVEVRKKVTEAAYVHFMQAIVL